MTDETLKPCPWPRCGEWERREVRVTADPDLCAVTCLSCGACGPARFTQTEAVAAWNRRPEPEPRTCAGCQNFKMNPLTAGFLDQDQSGWCDDLLNHVELEVRAGYDGAQVMNVEVSKHFGCNRWAKRDD